MIGCMNCSGVWLNGTSNVVALLESNKASACDKFVSSCSEMPAWCGSVPGNPEWRSCRSAISSGVRSRQEAAASEATVIL